MGLSRAEELRLIDQSIAEHGVTVLPPTEEGDKRKPLKLRKDRKKAKNEWLTSKADWILTGFEGVVC